MDEIMKLQDEALLYLRDNITREEAYYILTTENEMTEVLIAKKEDGSKRIKILDMNILSRGTICCCCSTLMG